MIEVWLGLFAFIFIRNKFIENYFESNGIFKYKQYSVKQLFKHWSIYPPLLFVIFYLYLEYTMFVQNYYFLPYSHIIKTAILLSYIPLVIIYQLYENPKYINNQFFSLVTSPMMKSSLCLIIGSLLNKIATYCNHGMPTYPSISYWTKYIKPGNEFIDSIHIIGTPYSALIPICNIWDLGYTIISIGDLIIRFYVFLILFNAIKISNKKLIK